MPICRIPYQKWFIFKTVHEFHCRVCLRTMKNYPGVKIDEAKLQDIFFCNHLDIETFVSNFNKLLMVITRKMLLQISCTQKPQSMLLYCRFLSALPIANMRYIGVQMLRVKFILNIYSKFLQWRIDNYGNGSSLSPHIL